MKSVLFSEIVQAPRGAGLRSLTPLTAYGLTLAALLLFAGALGDRFGRRGALIAGIIVFGSTAVLSVWADTPNQLIALRAIMGIGAALIMPGTLSTITSVFPPEGRAKAVGIWAGFAGAGGTLGILMSGALLDRVEPSVDRLVRHVDEHAPQFAVPEVTERAPELAAAPEPE